MNVMSAHRFVRRLALAAALVALAHPALVAQQTPAAAAPAVQIDKLVAEPASLTLKAGETVPLKVTAYDAKGNVVANPPLRLSGARNAMRIGTGDVTGVAAGSYEIIAMTVAAGTTPVSIRIPVKITWPAIAKVDLTADAGRLYTGTTLGHRAVARHADGSARPSGTLTWTWTSSAPTIASVDRFGTVTGLRPGVATITAATEGARGTMRYTVAANPVATLAIQLKDSVIRTGDVLHLKALAKSAGGAAVADAPITWSYTYVPDDSIAAPGATGVIDRGLFTAEVPGRYTLLATAGSVTARTAFEVKPRDVRRKITMTGRGNINNVHTSDLWPWTGKDGRDYVIVGTWGGDGYAMIMDITDLNNIVKVDSVHVDARTINDVTISPDGRYGVIAREGASNRVNGVVLLDLATPAHPKIAATFDQELTGGVHNMFATNDYLFAISGGDKYVIIDVKDVYHPKYVSEYNHPDSRVHDVWVSNGIAYSSEWGTGVVAVDVGNGKWGGTIEHPKLINTYPTTSGGTHEVYPYVQRSTGKVYLFLGDEIMSRTGKVWEGNNYSLTSKGGVPQTSGGYTHIVDFTDPMHPVNIAQYHQEEFGTHDIIVEDDVLYQAYYDGGLRVVDVSGELVGNLATQGREMAVFKSYDPNGYTANAPFVMNAMPWKGHILFTDFNSGLWSVKLEPKKTLVP